MKKKMSEPPDLRGRTIRDIGYVAWKDDKAGLEKMNGDSWNEATRSEERRWDAALRSLTSRRERYKFERELRGESAVLERAAFEPGWMPLKMEGTINGPPALRAHFRAAITNNGHIWTIRDAHNGAEKYNLTFWKNGSVRGWVKKDVGSTLAVLGGRCYYVIARRIHWMSEVRSCDAMNGGDDRSEFEVASDRENADIIGMPGGVFIRVEDSGSSGLWWSKGLGFKPIVERPAGYQVPFGFNAAGEPVYAIRGHDSDTYKWVGLGTRAFKPPGAGRPLWGSYHRGIVITRTYAGGADIYVYGRRVRSYPVASLIVNTSGEYDTLQIVVQTPEAEPELIEVRGDGSVKVQGGHRIPGLHSYMKHAISADGTRVPYLVIRRGSDEVRANRMLVYGYGSYGVPTFNGRVMAQWGPLLRRGWAVVYAMVRGSGDGTDSWAQAARLTGRRRGVDDFEAVIRTAQGHLGIDAMHTAVAGRSAGGLLVGAITARWPRGQLFHSVFVEVPYVDILRTTTNPGLPLTSVEYNEFGWPEKRVEDFAALMELAPIEGLPAEGAPMISVICRSGRNDTQVLAYEPMKWIQRLRGVWGEAATAAAPKLLALKDGQGHFYKSGAAEAARAEDLTLLNALIGMREKNLGFKYKMPARKNMTRKDRKERSRKNMAGGKARKASRKATRKAARKGRKATRKH